MNKQHLFGTSAFNRRPEFIQPFVFNRPKSNDPNSVYYQAGAAQASLEQRLGHSWSGGSPGGAPGGDPDKQVHFDPSKHYDKVATRLAKYSSK